jgi:hypothetical protein
VILAAVLGLAQPRWSTQDIARAAQRPVRAIIVDTSASMLRLTSDGLTGLRRARLLGRQALDSAREGMVIETDRPGASVPGAASWLAGRSGLRELVIVSDFQEGAVADGNLASVDAGIGIRTERVPLSVSSPFPDNRELLGAFADVVRVAAEPDRTVATWAPSSPDTALSVVVLAGDNEQEGVRASMAAVRATAPRPRASRRRVAVVFPGHDARRALAERTTPLDGAWQGDLLISLQRDRVLSAASESSIVTALCDAHGVAVARNARGEVVAALAKAPQGGTYDVLIFACVEPATMAGTALIGATESALDPVPSLRELEPAVVPDETLRRWERPPTTVAPHVPDETSPDGSWFWFVAIVLLLLEEWLRRRSPRPGLRPVNEVRRERVA